VDRLVRLRGPRSRAATDALPAFPRFQVNISANQISFATDITALMPRYLTIFRCSILASILCWATNPWRIVTNATGTSPSYLSAHPPASTDFAFFVTS
jgi:hypothetical protein